MELPRHRTKVWPRLEKFKTLEAVVVISNGRTQNFFLFVVSIVCSALQNLIFFSKCSLVELQKQKNAHFCSQIIIFWWNNSFSKKNHHIKGTLLWKLPSIQDLFGFTDDLSIIFSIQTRLKKPTEKTILMWQNDEPH